MHGATAESLVLDATSLKIWRGTLLVITAAECCVQTGASLWQAQYRPAPIPGPYGFFANRGVTMALLAIITITALWRFLGPRASLAAGFVALAGMKICGETFERVFLVHHQDFYQGGALLMGAVLGEAYAHLAGVSAGRGAAERLEARRFGMTGALGMLAASYMAAGASKVLTGGIGWATSSTLRLMILSHGPVEGSDLSLAIPHWVAANPYVCLLLEVGTLIIQLGAFMLVVGPRARRLWAVLIVAFHLGIYVTSYILFLTPMLFALVVAIPWPAVLRRRRAAAGEPGEVEQMRARPGTHAGALLALAAALVVAMRLGHGW